MSLIVSQEPSLYIHDKDIIVTFQGELIQTPLSAVVAKAKDLKEISRVILTRLLKKLGELSVSFSITEVKLERDAEISSWEYAVIKIKIDVGIEIFEELCNILISHSYSDIEPEDATKVLLVFYHV